MNITKGIIFDLDGTLLDSMTVWYEADQVFLRTQGVEVDFRWAEHVKAKGFWECVDYMIDTFGLTCTPEDVANGVGDVVTQKYRDEVLFKPYAKEFLQQMRKQGVRMCIVTAGLRPTAELALQRLGVLDWFEFLLSGEELGMSKMQPEIYLLAAKQLELPVQEITVFEDALHCVRTAKSAGFPVVGVEEATLSETDRAAVQREADCYIRSFQELLTNS